MDIQHITDKKHSLRLFKNYDVETGLSIALPAREHFLLTKFKKKEFVETKELIEQEVRSLLNYTDIPDELLEDIKYKLIQRYL